MAENWKPGDHVKGLLDGIEIVGIVRGGGKRDLRDDMDHERPWVLAADPVIAREWADVDATEIKWEGIQ